MNLQIRLICVTALTAALSPALAQDSAKSKTKATGPAVVVEHGDDRVEVRFGPGAKRPSVRINGRAVPARDRRSAGGEYHFDAGDFDLSVTVPALGWSSVYRANNVPLLAQQLRPDLPSILANPEANKPKREPYIGVKVGSVPPALAEHLGLDASECVLVLTATDGGPAAKAGLAEHDILTAIDGVDGATDETLRSAINSKRPGETLTLGILRRGRAQKVEIEVGEQLRPGSWNPLWARFDSDDYSNWATAPRPNHLPKDLTGLAYAPLLQSYFGNLEKGKQRTDDIESLRQQIDEIRKMCERIEQQLENKKNDPR